MKRLSLICLVGFAAVVLAAAPARADFIDLQTAGSSGSDGSVLFFEGPVGSGTGVFPSFVQVSGAGQLPANGSESAYNTTVNGVLQNGSDDNHNHEITIADLATSITVYNGVSYYTFYLDINENNNSIDQYLSLDDIKIILSPTANQSSTPLPTGTTIYDLSATGILFNYSNEQGSGYSDMTMLVPTALFVGDPSTTYVYLFSQFGLVGTTCTDPVAPNSCVAGADYGPSDGFEEWSKKTSGTTTIVPDGGTTVGLLGFLFLLLNR